LSLLSLDRALQMSFCTGSAADDDLQHAMDRPENIESVCSRCTCSFTTAFGLPGLGLLRFNAGAGGDSITDCTTAATPAAAALADLGLRPWMCSCKCTHSWVRYSASYPQQEQLKGKTSSCSFARTANNTRTACAHSAADQGGLCD